MLRKVEAFLHFNRHDLEIADMVHSDYLFTFQEDSNQKPNSPELLFSNMQSKLLHLLEYHSLKRHRIRGAFLSEGLASAETALKYLWPKLCTMSVKRLSRG